MHYMCWHACFWRYCLCILDYFSANITLLNFSCKCQPHILKPTRITSHSSTLIDNIFFNSIEYQTVSGNLLHDLTDHLPNFLIIEKFAFSIHKEKSFRRDYSNFNEEAF